MRLISDFDTTSTIAMVLPLRRIATLLRLLVALISLNSLGKLLCNLCNRVLTSPSSLRLGLDSTRTRLHRSLLMSFMTESVFVSTHTTKSLFMRASKRIIVFTSVQSFITWKTIPFTSQSRPKRIPECHKA
eukprot:Rmarinus@m.20100